MGSWISVLVFSIFFFSSLRQVVRCNDETLSAQDLSKLAEKLKTLPESEACLNAAYKKCQEGDWEIIRELAQLLSRLKDSRENTLLTSAIKCADYNIVKNLLESEIGLKEKDSEGNTPLHLAASLNLHQLIPLLLKTGTDNHPLFNPNARNQKGDTPIHIAIDLGHDRALDFLLEKADLDKQKKNGYNLLHFAVACEQFQIVDYLLSKHWQKISKLIKEPNNEGLSPLSLAAYLGETQSVYILVKKGADIQIKDPDGNTPLHWACQRGWKETIDCLISLDAELKVSNKLGYEPKELIDTQTSKGKKLLAYFESLEKGRRQSKKSLSLPIKNIVFQGGGPKGIAYIPVIRELEEKKILEHIERVAGVSAGAITATLIALGYSSEDIKRELNKEVDGQPILIKFLDYPAVLKEEAEEFLEIANQGVLVRRFEEGFGWKEIVKAGLQGALRLLLLTSKKKAALKKTYKNGGFCSGDFFLNWMEKKIEEATGIKHCTFGDLQDLIKNKTPLRNGKTAKHLYVVATKIGDQHSSIEFNSETDFTKAPEYRDLIISDAIRMSMSIPFAYPPHLIHRREKDGSRKAYVGEGFFIDGGILNNFPINIFDKKKFKNEYNAQENPEASWTNPHTIGFSLYPPKSETNSTDHTMSVIGRELTDLCLNAEMTRKREQEKSRDRMVEINNQGIGLFEFNLSPEKEKALFQEAEKQTKLFFKKYALGNLTNLDVFYNYGLFKEKEANGTLSLTPPCPGFSGRQQELSKIKNMLLNGSWETECPFVSIIGERGYGKSELAMVFASLHLKEFSLLWKIDHRNPESLEKSYKKLAHSLKISKIESYSFDELRSEVNRRLEASSTRWLLIFDNVDEGGIPSCPTRGGSILLTTTDRTSFQNKNPFYLEGLGLDGETLMEGILGKDPGISQLAKDLRYVPLLMVQAASYIKKEEIDAAQYRSLLFHKGLLPTSCYRTLLEICWEIASEKLKKHQEETYDWLLFCSFFDNKEIPKEWLQTLLASRQKKQPALLYTEMQDILSFLTSYGLISSYKYDETFSMHGYFQEIVRKSKQSDENVLSNLLSLMLEFQEVKEYNPTDPEISVAFGKVLPHVISVFNYSKQLSHPSDKSISLGLTIIRYLIETKRDIPRAREYLDSIKDLASKFPDHPRQGRIEFFYGRIDAAEANETEDPLIKKNLYKKALGHFGKACDIYNAHSESKEYENLEQNKDKCNQRYQTGICLDYQAKMLVELEEFDKAINLFEKAKSALDPFRFDVPRIIRDKANILLKQKKPLLAIAEIKEAIRMQRIIYKERFESHPTVAATYTKLGEAYELLETGEGLEGAENAYKDAITTNIKAYRTENHPYIMRLYGKRAGVAKKLGKLDLADEMQKKQLEIQKYLDEHI